MPGLASPGGSQAGAWTRFSREERCILRTSAGRDGIGFRRRSTFCAAIARKSARTRVRGTPRGCPPACHSGRGGDGIDSAKQRSARRPSATGPARSRAWCGASRPMARYAAPAAHAEWRLRRSRDPRAHSLAAVAVAPVAVQRGNRIDQRQGFLRVVPIRAGETYGERHASPVANQMALAPPLRPIGRVRTSLVTAMYRADGTAVHNRSRPINLIVSSEPIQQREVNEIPHARSLPIAQAAPTRHPRPAPEFLREHLPRDAAAEDEQNAGETRAIGNSRASTFRPTW